MGREHPRRRGPRGGVRLRRRPGHAPRGRGPGRARGRVARLPCGPRAPHRQCARGHDAGRAGRAVTGAADTTPEEAIPPKAAGGDLPIGKAAIFGFAVAHFSHHVTNSLLSPLLPLIRDTFALSYTQQGLAVSAFSLSVGLANAPLGVLADRIGSRAVLAGGLVLLGLSSIALALTGAFWQLLVVLVLMGIISGTYHAPAVALISRAFPERGRGAVMGLHTTGGHMSFFAAPLVAGA
ncbi:MAG: MFS transporter, partial [Chloroflexi bacterium]|nr:MFS transporter [Chloroflexota bacterium]